MPPRQIAEHAQFVGGSGSVGQAMRSGQNCRRLEAY